MKDLKKSYFEYNKNLLIKRSAIGCILAIFLVPAGISLDYFMYRSLLSEFVLIRLFCSLLLVPALLIHYTKIGKKYITLLVFAWMIIIQASMCYMIATSNDYYLSTYYAGLNLVILGVGLLLPFSALEVLIFCFITTIFYIVSATYGVEITNYRILFNNLYFIVLTSIISITASYFSTKSRLREFKLSYNLKTANEKLENSNDKLTNANEELKTVNIKLISTQAQLIQSEKISAMGHLSAGILHEINNPLNYTIAAVRIVKMDDKIIGDEDLKDTVADIEEGMNRIKNIVSDLHNFSHPEEAGKYNQFAIADAIESSVRFTAAECKDIEKIIDVPKDLMVSGAKTHIVQILINLITNACKAIAKAGNAKAENGGIIKIWTEQKNNRVIIFVSDNGIGMNEETLAKVFDPFFTTSEVGKGMGMGLSVSYTIAKNHGGTLSATSKLGDGSVFSFDLSMTNS